MSGQVVVIGGGAAGMLAAWRSASLGVRTVLLEKTSRLGTKILISGGGKCNITHNGPLEAVLRAYRPEEARFLRPSFYRFPNTEIIRMLTERGLRVYTRPDGRIFPVDQTAKDVMAILEAIVTEAGVHIHKESPVVRLEPAEGTGFRIVVGDPLDPKTGYQARPGESNSREFRASAVVLAVGGSSYPNSGTTGDGYRWLEALGHSCVPVRAALAPMYLATTDVKPEWSGVAFRDVVLRARASGRKPTKWRGDLLFTHQGVSGPCALGISREVTEWLLDGPVSLDVDLRPDESPEQTAAFVLSHAQANPAQRVRTFVADLVPDRLADGFLTVANIAPETTFAKLDRKGRNRLVERLRQFPLGEVRTVPLEKGEVVAGGIPLAEVDPQTLASRTCPGLFTAGEILDIAGPVGGYNLQAAFATGFVAGESAARVVNPSLSALASVR